MKGVVYVVANDASLADGRWMVAIETAVEWGIEREFGVLAARTRTGGRGSRTGFAGK